MSSFVLCFSLLASFSAIADPKTNIGGYEIEIDAYLRSVPTKRGGDYGTASEISQQIRNSLASAKILDKYGSVPGTQLQTLLSAARNLAEVAKNQKDWSSIPRGQSVTRTNLGLLLEQAKQIARRLEVEKNRVAAERKEAETLKTNAELRAAEVAFIGERSQLRSKLHNCIDTFKTESENYVSKLNKAEKDEPIYQARLEKLRAELATSTKEIDSTLRQRGRRNDLLSESEKAITTNIAEVNQAFMSLSAIKCEDHLKRKDAKAFGDCEAGIENLEKEITKTRAVIAEVQEREKTLENPTKEMLQDAFPGNEKRAQQILENERRLLKTTLELAEKLVSDYMNLKSDFSSAKTVTEKIKDQAAERLNETVKSADQQISGLKLKSEILKNSLAVLKIHLDFARAEKARNEKEVKDLAYKIKVLLAVERQAFTTGIQDSNKHAENCSNLYVQADKVEFKNRDKLVAIQSEYQKIPKPISSLKKDSIR